MNKQKKPTTNWVKVRKFLNDIHLWGGLISGIIVFIVCLTGTIYVYNTEIRQLAQSKYHQVEVEGQRINADALLTQTKSQIPGKIVGIKIPFNSDATTQILYTKKEKEEKGKSEGKGATLTSEKSNAHPNIAGAGPEKKEMVQAIVNSETPNKKSSEEKNESKVAGAAASKGAKPAAPAGRGPRANIMAVNPYTGVLIGDPSEEKSATIEFMGKMFSLHRWLMLNEIETPLIDGVENRKLGSWITGTATLLFLLGVITGIVIWVPNKIRSWKNGLKIRWSANWKRVNHDLHNTLGFYSCIILFFMAVTGPFWSFDWYRAGWQKTWGTYKAPDAPKEEQAPLLSQIPSDGKNPMSIEETIAVVNKILPYQGDITINFAKDSTGTLAITKNKIGFFAPSASDRITLDQYSGEVLNKEIFKEKPFNQRASASIKALHVGDIYGPFSKLLYFISCLIATSLPVTGVMIWINKMKKKPKKVISTKKKTLEMSENKNSYSL